MTRLVHRDPPERWGLPRAGATVPAPATTDLALHGVTTLFTFSLNAGRASNPARQDDDARTTHRRDRVVPPLCKRPLAIGRSDSTKP